MRNMLFILFGLCIFVVSGVFADRAEAGTGQLACSVTIRKNVSSPPAGSIPEFEFLVEPSGEDDFVFVLTPAGEEEFNLNFGQSAAVSENVPPGWSLTDVECEASPGIAISIDEDNNVLIDCLTAGLALCAFLNERTGSASIPTLSEWGMIAAVVGLALVGVFFAVRRKKIETA